MITDDRLHLSRLTSPKKKSQFGQFFTPERTAAFMAGLFPFGEGECRLLDAGAGIGSLTAAFLDRWAAGGLGFQRVVVDAYEIDEALRPYWAQNFAEYERLGAAISLHGDDFIHAAVKALAGAAWTGPVGIYTHAILNPPYKKINSKSAHRLALRDVGIETVNLYSAFVALSIALVRPGGHIVAIIPRSFCNGPYYRPFRDLLLSRTVIRRMHLFGARDKAFRDDDVLQENIIIHLERAGVRGDVSVSTSTDDTFSDMVEHRYSFDKIVPPDNPNLFIHVPTSAEQGGVAGLPSTFGYSLADLNLQVSTGPVVDFRHRDDLRELPGVDTVPLLYPVHFGYGGLRWPLEKQRKPNAIRRSPSVERWLYPNGFYCVVRRFSSKEEPRRVVASVVDPGLFSGADSLGFENHLNVYHAGRRGLSEHLARGLAVYLNSTLVDVYFRRFNGHTQVNATDLRSITYPSYSMLERLGEWAMQQETLTQTIIDTKIGELLYERNR